MTKLFLTYSYDDGPLWLHKSKESAERGRETYVECSIDRKDPEFYHYVEEIAIFEVDFFRET